MLNALRHLRFGHQSVSQRRPDILVLNALRHLRFGHTCYEWLLAVLNALRHLRLGITSRSGRQLLVYVSAQRLAASKVWAYQGAPGPCRSRACSTPCGI